MDKMVFPGRIHVTDEFVSYCQKSAIRFYGPVFCKPQLDSHLNVYFPQYLGSIFRENRINVTSSCNFESS